MLTREENDLLTRVTGDAPAGRMLRRYWLPACGTEEIERTPSVTVRMLGDDLTVVRNPAGAIAVYDAAGHAYPARDAGALIWTYLGPPALEPPFPAYDWTAMPREQLCHMKYVEHANYLQCAEGTIDTTHSWFLHSGSAPDWKQRTALSLDFAPKLEPEDTAYGFRYAAIRRPNADADTKKYVKITVYAFPTTGFIARPLDPNLAALVQIFVPIDDETTTVFSLMHACNGKSVDADAIREDLRQRPGIDQDGRFRPNFCTGDGWIQDRPAMRARTSYTGIYGFPNQDIAVQESMGRIVDRTREHLGTSDIAIIRMRRLMLESVRRVMNGQRPIGLDAPVDYANLRAEQAVIPIDEPWQSVGPAATHGDDTYALT
jgi:phthalate 4,5-dioxygenase oxygenase subunit